MTAEEGSIALAKDRLRLWLDRGTSGMARLEYVSQFSRAAVVESLRGVVRVDEVVLEAGSTAEQVAALMMEAVRRAAGANERTVVSFSGLDRALPEPVADSLRVLNFQRESFAEGGAAQIWWMPPHFLGAFVRAARDLDSWFDLKLSVTEAVGGGEARAMWVEAADIVTPGEARRRAGSLIARAETALRAGEPWEPVWKELVSPAVEVLRSAELHDEASREARRLAGLIGDLQADGVAQRMTASGAAALAKVYRDQGDYAAARDAAIRALTLAEREGGPDSPDVAACRSNLANILGTLGEHKEARKQIELALESGLRLFGPDHPNVAVNRSNLAIILRNLGEFQEARKQIELALESDLRLFGPDHPTVAVSRSNLAIILRNLGEFQEARKQIELALESGLRLFGPDHPTVAVSRINLAVVLFDLERFEDALEQAELALGVFKAKLPSGHPNIQTAAGWRDAIRARLGKV